AGDQAVSCPRCRSPHHLSCWIENGGCAKPGCRQVVDPSLLPEKEEEPIRASRMSPWAITAVIGCIVLLGVGLYTNIKRAQEQRGATIGIMISSMENESLWNDVVAELNELSTMPKPAELYFTPYGAAGTAYEQKMVVLMAARESPEIVLFERDRYATYAEQQALVPLDDLPAALAVRGITLDRARLDELTIDGQLYGLPHPNRPAVISVSRLSIDPDLGKQVLVDLYVALWHRFQ